MAVVRGKKKRFELKILPFNMSWKKMLPVVSLLICLYEMGFMGVTLKFLRTLYLHKGNWINSSETDKIYASVLCRILRL